MPSVTAARLCPDAIWLPGRMDLYVEVSRCIRRILDEEAPVVEPLSIDEAFLDMTGLARDLTEGAAIARKLKDRIRAEERLTASVGVAPNKFLAKVASDLEKPDGLCVISKEDVPRRLWPLPVERLWGVGPKVGGAIPRGGLRTIGDVAKRTESSLATLVGAGLAAHAHALALGEDDRPVSAGREAKSISEERTYGDDLTDPRDIDRGAARARRRRRAVPAPPRADRQDGASQGPHGRFRDDDAIADASATLRPREAIVDAAPHDAPEIASTFKARAFACSASASAVSSPRGARRSLSSSRPPLSARASWRWRRTRSTTSSATTSSPVRACCVGRAARPRACPRSTGAGDPRAQRRIVAVLKPGLKALHEISWNRPLPRRTLQTDDVERVRRRTDHRRAAL
jgi:hypothetical protein